MYLEASLYPDRHSVSRARYRAVVQKVCTHVKTEIISNDYHDNSTTHERMWLARYGEEMGLPGIGVEILVLAHEGFVSVKVQRLRSFYRILS